jgi:hypothetical protein
VHQQQHNKNSIALSLSLSLCVCVCVCVSSLSLSLSILSAVLKKQTATKNLSFGVRRNQNYNSYPRIETIDHSHCSTNLCS